jgi:hypothetical protein
VVQRHREYVERVRDQHAGRDLDHRLSRRDGEIVGIRRTVQVYRPGEDNLC